MSEKIKMVGVLKISSVTRDDSSSPRYVFHGVEDDARFKVLLDLAREHSDRWRKGCQSPRSCLISVMREEFFVPSGWDLVMV